jgi:hypothetical protein
MGDAKAVRCLVGADDAFSEPKLACNVLRERATYSVCSHLASTRRNRYHDDQGAPYQGHPAPLSPSDSGLFDNAEILATTQMRRPIR